MVLQKILDAGFLADVGVDKYIEEKNIDLDKFLEFAKSKDNALIITKELVDEFASNKSVEVKRPPTRAIASEYSARIEKVERFDVTGKSVSQGTVADFVELFRDRFKRLASVLRGYSGPYPISRYNGVKRGGKARFIGMVRSKMTTKNGHMILEVEDTEGTLKVFISKNNQDLLKRALNILLDEVLAFDGQYRDPFFFAENFIRPDIPVVHEKKLISEELSIAFLSDVHVGSKLFMEDGFKRFLQWIKGEYGGPREKKLASQIKYLLIAGDLVDGIGIYPGQEKELNILDIYDQYAYFFNFLEEVPDYIDVVIIPGNHDAVRRGEPQPQLPSEFVKQRSNYHFGSNPSLFKIEGLNTVMYHGTSIDSMIANISGLSYSAPEKVMVEYLKRRHLSPLYGSNHIIPEPFDYMVLEEVPDIVHMGHVHKNGYDEYRGVVVINSGTWQDQTDYQKKQGHIPTPCQLPIYNMYRGTLHELKFV